MQLAEIEYIRLSEDMVTTKMNKDIKEPFYMTEIDEKKQNEADPKTTKEKVDDAFKSLLANLADNTGMHGVPHIRHAGSSFRRLFWLLVLLFGLAMLIYNLEAALAKYYSYPSDTTVGVSYSPSLIFPAVTLCNMNPIRKTALEGETSANFNDLKDIFGMPKPEGDNSGKGGGEGKDGPGDGGPGDGGPDYGGPGDDGPGDDGPGNGGGIGGGTGDGNLGAELPSELLPNQNNVKPLDDAPVKQRKKRSAVTVPSINQSVEVTTTSAQQTSTNTPVFQEDRWKEPVSEDYYEEPDEDFKKKSSYSELIANMTTQAKQELGHQLDDMLMMCSFNGKPCRPNNFTSHFNQEYGNCFTFNSGHDDQTLHNVSKSGSLYGLKMELFIQQDEYFSDITDSAGVRVVIHDQAEMPFPEDRGFSVEPGVSAFIGISMKQVVRVMDPYGNCKNFTDAENEKKNAFVESLGFVKYSMEACKKTCYQNHMIRECNCADSQFPSTGKALNTAIRSIKTTTVDACNTTSDTDSSCMSKVSNDFIEDKLGCSTECPPTCLQHYYERHMSYSQWPSLGKEDAIVEKLETLSESAWQILKNIESPDARKAYTRNNVLKLQIYYSTLDYDTIITKPSYQGMDVLSDVGGQVGLWLGLSVITLFEALEFIVDICKLCMHKTKRKSKVTTEEAGGRRQSKVAFK